MAKKKTAKRTPKPVTLWLARDRNGPTDWSDAYVFTVGVQAPENYATSDHVTDWRPAVAQCPREMNRLLAPEDRLEPGAKPVKYRCVPKAGEIRLVKV